MSEKSNLYWWQHKHQKGMSWLVKHWLYLTPSHISLFCLYLYLFLLDPVQAGPHTKAIYFISQSHMPPDLLENSQELCFRTQVLKKERDMWTSFHSPMCINQQSEPSDILFVRRRLYKCLIISSFGSQQSHSLVNLKAWAVNSVLFQTRIKSQVDNKFPLS